MQTLHFHFIGNPKSGDDLKKLRELPWDQGTIACVRHAWVWPLYCRFRMLGVNVSFSYAPQAGAINFIHGQIAREFLKPADLKHYFFVGIRADFRPFPYGFAEIVQNRKVEGGRRRYMAHLPQPGLVVRDPSRTEVKNVCFAGQINNCLDAELLRADLEQVGCRFLIKHEDEWNNLSDVDILLGIRSFSRKRYDSKPPTKLFNAWLAGIPFIGGYDSAFSQVGTPGKNYARVSSRTQFIRSIQQLRQDSDFYKAMVRAGDEAAKGCSADVIIHQWVVYMQETVVPLYHRWARGDAALRRLADLRSRLFGLYEKGIRGY